MCARHGVALTSVWSCVVLCDGVGCEDRWALEASASIEVLQPVLSQDDDEEAGAERRKRREGRSLSVGALGERKRRFTRLLARDQCLSVMVLGMLCAVLAGAVWEASEQLCPKPQWAWLRYLRLHSFWHLAIGYGTCLILQVRDTHKHTYT